jgi:flagellar protein FliJ
MRAFSFKLEKVLEVRSYYERIAEMKLAEKSGRCALLEIKLKENAEKTHAAALDRFGRGRSIFDFMATELYMRRLEQDRERTMRELAAAELEREKARAEYLEASKAKKIIEKLKEREQREYYKAAQRAEAKMLDDVAQSTWMRDHPAAASNCTVE